MKRVRPLLSPLALALAVLLVYARVLLTPLIPASGDFLTYFTPYWRQLNLALRAGRLPLWNDFIFGGAPFLANPQTQVFYPLRWPFIFLSAEKGILCFDALHAWLAGVFGYLLVRALLPDKSRLPALTAGLLLALNGWVTGLLLHPNQAGTYPWLLAALWLWEVRPRPGQWPRNDAPTRRWVGRMALVWALAFLAGHTQSFYNNLVLFGVWVLADGVWRARASAPSPGRAASGMRARLAARVADAWPALLVALVLAGALVAVQLLPTLELSRLSYRHGGLPFRDHAALSLPPWRLGFTLLPHYARDMGMALGTEAYGEWMGYVGITGLFLALLGLQHPLARGRVLGITLTLAGLLLAMGAYTPLDYVLYGVMPGWDLFRVPARFLAGAMVGLSILAALGVHTLLAARPTSPSPLLVRVSRLAALLLVGLAVLTRPNLPTLLGWGMVGVLLILIVRGRGRYPRLLLFLPLLLLVELLLASHVLPIQHPTAAQALRSWRTAPARIAAEIAHQADPPRTLSLSPTTWDPGDLGDLQRIYGPYLDTWAMTDLINATKAKEVLAPNLGMFFDIPSLDGFGGGVLPTARFVRAMTLFLPADRVVADGRLREQLNTVPNASLLSLFHVGYVIVGKNFDVWHNDIYYDLAFGEPLTADQPTLVLTQMPTFPISGVGVVSHVGPEAASLPSGTPIAQVDARFVDGTEIHLPLRVGLETGVGPDAARPPAQNQQPAVRWPYHAPGQDFIAELDFPPQSLPSHVADRRLASLSFRLLQPQVTLFIRGVALYDRDSHAHASPIVTRFPWRRIHSGDVKIYRNEGLLPRAFAVPQARILPTLADVVAFMKNPDFDPAQVAVLDQPIPLPENLSPARVRLETHTPERVRVHVQSQGNALVVLADAWNPGWHAILDPDQQPQRLTTFPVNIFLRGVLVPPGDHEVVWVFRPRALRLGALISLLAAFVLAGVVFWR